VEILGGLDIVVPNAVTAWNEAIADASAEHIEKTLDLNLRGPAHTVQEALRHISDEGRIILISSLSAQISAFPGQTVYGMSKAALTALGRYDTPDEVGNLVAWLASEQSSYITGSVINIDGGVTA
jgi:3-oxoacyl-[acyl-carrier protein] reductase